MVVWPDHSMVSLPISTRRPVIFWATLIAICRG